jgi:hypothetical protein
MEVLVGRAAIAGLPVGRASTRAGLFFELNDIDLASLTASKPES